MGLHSLSFHGAPPRAPTERGRAHASLWRVRGHRASHRLCRARTAREPVRTSLSLTRTHRRGTAQARSTSLNLAASFIMSSAAAPFLLRLPFLYPLAGAVALLWHWDIGAKALGYAALQLLLPLYWLSARLSEKHHEKIFTAVYERRAGRTAAAAAGPPALSPRQAAALAAVDAVTAAAATPVDAAAAGAAAAAATTPHSPLVAALLLLIRPPPTAAGWLVSAARRAVSAPLGLAFPALPRALAVLSTGDLGSAWLAPYLRAARKAASKGVTGGIAGAASLARAGPAASAAFGAVALALSCVPIVSRLLAFFTAAGAALWAADLAAAG